MTQLSQTLQKDGQYISDVEMLALLAGLGEIGGVSTVGKFGYTQNADSGVLTDLHDGANPTANQALVIAPTQARVHAIVSSSASDDKDAGVGARTIRVYGLTDWDTKQVSEVVELEGLTPVNTANAYVFIHRMVVLTNGATNINVGNITATAATDTTITARILAGNGQTEMAAYAVPTTQRLCVLGVYGSLLKGSGASTAVDLTLKVNPTPADEVLNFITKHRFTVDSSASSNSTQRFEVPRIYEGGCIIKLQAVSSAANAFVSGGFDAILIDN